MSDNAEPAKLGREKEYTSALQPYSGDQLQQLPGIKRLHQGRILCMARTLYVLRTHRETSTAVTHIILRSCPLGRATKVRHLILSVATTSIHAAKYLTTLHYSSIMGSPGYRIPCYVVSAKAENVNRENS